MSNDIKDLFAELETTTIEDKPVEQPIRKKYIHAEAEPYKRDINLAIKNNEPIDVVLDLALQCIAKATDEPLFYEQNKHYAETAAVLRNEAKQYFRPYIELVKKAIKEGLTDEIKDEIRTYNNIFSEYDRKLTKESSKLKGWVYSELERLEKE